MASKILNDMEIISFGPPYQSTMTRIAPVSAKEQLLEWLVVAESSRIAAVLVRHQIELIAWIAALNAAPSARVMRPIDASTAPTIVETGTANCMP